MRVDALIEKYRNKDHSGINMVDLMMWLVIAALLLAAAIQGIGYYQKAAMLYTMKSDASGAGANVVSIAASSGDIDRDAADQGTADTNWSKDVAYSVEDNTNGGMPYFRVTHPLVDDVDVIYLFEACGEEYDIGVNVVPKDSNVVLESCGIAAPPADGGDGGTGDGGPSIQPVAQTATCQGPLLTRMRTEIALLTSDVYKEYAATGDTSEILASPEYAAYSESMSGYIPSDDEVHVKKVKLEYPSINESYLEYNALYQKIWSREGAEGDYELYHQSATDYYNQVCNATLDFHMATVIFPHNSDAFTGFAEGYNWKGSSLPEASSVKSIFGLYTDGAAHGCYLTDSDVLCHTAGSTNIDEGGTEKDGELLNKNSFFLNKSVSQVDTLGREGCAILDGEGYCWGENTLGNTSVTSSTTPVPVSTSAGLAGKTVTDISARGNSRKCLVADGEPFCWGYMPDYSVSNVPTNPDTNGVLSGKTVTDIETKNTLTCLIADGEPYCWGSGSAVDGSVNQVTKVAEGSLAGKTAVSLSLNQNTACVTTSDNEIHCWGYGGDGLLGPSMTNSVAPVKINLPEEVAGGEISKLLLDQSHVRNEAMAIINGGLYYWNDDSNGEVKKAEFRYMEGKQVLDVATFGPEQRIIMQ